MAKSTKSAAVQVQGNVTQVRFGLEQCQKAIADKSKNPQYAGTPDSEFAKILLRQFASVTSKEGVEYLESVAFPPAPEVNEMTAMDAGASMAMVGETIEQKIARLEAENERLRAQKLRTEEKSDLPQFTWSKPSQVGKAKESNTWYPSQPILKGGGLRANMGTAYMTPSILKFIVNTVLDEHERAKMLAITQEADRVNREFEATMDWRTSKGWYGIGTDANGRPKSMFSAK